MESLQLQPSTHIKRLVGEHVDFRIKLNPEFSYQVELYTNVNRGFETYVFDREGDWYVCRVNLTKSGFFKWQIRFRREGSKTWRWLRKEQRKRITGFIQVDPAWLDQAIVYNVFVRFFMGKVAKDGATIAPGEGGTFDDVKTHLDALKAMGISVLYFNPIHLIGELNRKYNMLDQLPPYLQPGSPYSIKDYKSIDPELTYDKDTKHYLLSDPQKEFKDLIAAAHERGMFVIMDMVFNHTAHDFVFQRIRPEWYLYKENITSLEDPYLYPQDMKEGKPWGDPKHTMSPYDHGIWWDDAAQLNWEYRIPEGPNKPPKNPSLKEMWEYFKSIPKYWVKHFGVDGFRCDIAYRVPPAFWKACIAETRELAQAEKNNLSHDVVFIGEAYTDDLKELQEAGFSAVYGDYSNKLAHPQDLTGYLDYMYNLSNQFFPDGSKWFIFPEAHDFARTPQKVLGERAADLQAALRANQSRWLITATLPGIPLIFNGFEKIEWQPINLFSYGAVDWERNSDLRDFIAKVNSIRKRLKPIQLLGSYTPLTTSDDNTVAYLRSRGREHVLVVVNMNVDNPTGAITVHLPPNFERHYILTDELTGERFERNGKELLVMLDAGQGHLFSVQFR